MKNHGSYRIQILTWTAIGLVIRLILMPFTMHGQDLLFINYFPTMLIEEGIWDPYGFISNNFAAFPYTYYGPVLFIIIAGANFIFIKLLGAASLVKMLVISSTMMFKQFTTADYVQAFSGLELFKNLFLMKSPYLVFDFLIAAFLLKLASSRDLALRSYILWMVNVVVLHTAYMVGQFELIPAFFIVLALFFALKKRAHLAIICLCLGGAAKIFPYMLILPTCLLLGKNCKQRIALLFTAAGVFVFTYLPFYLSSGDAVLEFIIGSQAVLYPGPSRWVLQGIFVLAYAVLSLNAVKDSRKPQPERKLLFYFLTIGFLTYAVIPISLRYFIFIMPLLALLLPRHRRFALFILFIILLLTFLRVPTRYAQWGLFSPLNPEYFLNLPTIQEIAAGFVNIELVYKIMARVSLLCFFIATWWIWQIKLNAKQDLLSVETRIV